MKAQKNAGRSLGIAYDETREGLAIRSVVIRAASLHGVFVETRRLEEDLFLGLPEKTHQAEQQPERNKGGNHMRTLRGFQ
jgi:hypothetical protein